LKGISQREVSELKSTENPCLSPCTNVVLAKIATNVSRSFSFLAYAALP
jgi:hypothetical protein